MTEFDTERQDEVASTEQIEDGIASDESKDDVQSVIDSDVEVAQPDPTDEDMVEEPAPEVDEDPSLDEVVEEIEEHEGKFTETELVDEDQAEEREEQPSKVDASEEEELEAELEAGPLEDETEAIDTEQTDEAEDEVEATVVVPPPEPDDDRAWFVVHCYSGYENKVRHNLEQRIETMGMKNKIFDVVVPTEEEIEVKDGKRRTVERRVFPGYILVQMIMNEDSWYVVRNTPGVTGFVGMGNDPTPLRPEEVSQIVKRMEADAPRIKVTYAEGQKVRIIDGPFNDFIGTVADIDMERAKVRVMVSFFGRDTPVELDFLQVEKA